MPSLADADIRNAPSQDFLDDGRAACRDVDPELFFSGKEVEASEAKLICEHCPIRQGCYDWALPVSGLFGVWGGLSAPDRKRNRRKART